ncbi:hypothetical protein OAA91_00740 [Fibrobacterales bacterium]|nr:hypothetical protein [Fibrobacterales bacterium]
MRTSTNRTHIQKLLESPHSLSRKSFLLVSLLFIASCSVGQEPNSPTSDLSSSVINSSSSQALATSSEGDTKGCSEGEIYELPEITYTCIKGEWTTQNGDKDKENTDTNTGKGQLSTFTLIHDNQTREYSLYLPASFDGRLSLPIMLNFHGFGGNMADQMISANMRSLADTANFILVYPQGTLMDGVSHWNASLPSATNKSNADDLGFVNALINEIVLKHQADSTRVYASGYSNGGFMSHGLACHLSDKIAAIVGVSGTMIDIANCAPTHKTAMMAIHGTSDGTVPYEGGNGFSSLNETMEFWINYNKTNPTAVVEKFDDKGTAIEHHSYLDDKGDALVQHYKVIEGNHIWFNFNINGYSTNRLIWDFVSQWDINGKI